ncbi:MAG: tRNA (adenosine(37)-N6)-dimethylallyltransferase MiaA [Clostridiales bacterium]|nr:tRNA (adenosine(37)-N6)-dimethylallyltransferase MiaA [Clostridiales bacterium]
MKKTVLVIAGATGSGKTSAAIALAQKFGSEIVSCDSVAIYRGFDIGSAKPTVAEWQGVPHHMLDIADAREHIITAAEFKALARAAIADIHARDQLPILAGGSGLYIDAVLSDLDFAVPSDAETRKQILLEQEANPDAIWAKLQEADPVSAARLHPNDRKRIARALEVYQISGKPFSEWSADFAGTQTNSAHYRAIKLGLRPERAQLYAQINARAAQMLENGLLAETQGLLGSGHADTLPPMQAIGYAQCVQALRGQLSMPELLPEIQKATRHYAKRQETWFKRDAEIHWIAPSETEEYINTCITLKNS